MFAFSIAVWVALQERQAGPRGEEHEMKRIRRRNEAR
jgi:hypothetical protein